MPGRPPPPSGSSTTPAGRTRSARCTRGPPRWTGWSRSRSAASPSPRPRRRASGATAGSTSSTPRPRGLHGRGRALPARAGRRGRDPGRGGGRRAPDRDGLAPGGQVPGAADHLRQQDGPDRRRLLPLGRDDPEPPGRDPRGGPAAARRRGRLPGADRPHRRGRARLAGRGRQAGAGLRARADSRGVRRAGARVPRAPGRGPVRRRREPDGAVSRGREDRAGGPPGRGAGQHARDEARPGALRRVLQEQGRAAAPRRGRRLSALARSTSRRCRGSIPRPGSPRCGRPPTRSRSRRSPSS